MNYDNDIFKINLFLSSDGVSSVGALAIAFAVFGGAIGLLSFRAGRRNAYSELL